MDQTRQNDFINQTVNQAQQNDFSFNATVYNKVKNGTKSKKRTGFTPVTLSLIAICLFIALVFLLADFESDEGGAGNFLFLAAAIFIACLIPRKVTDVTVQTEFHFSDDALTIIYQGIDRGDERGIHTEELNLKRDDINSIQYDSGSRRLEISHAENDEGETLEELRIDDLQQQVALCIRLNDFAVGNTRSQQIPTAGLVSASQGVDASTTASLVGLDKSDNLEKRILRPYKVIMWLPAFLVLLYCIFGVVAADWDAESLFANLMLFEIFALIFALGFWDLIVFGISAAIKNQRVLIGSDRLVFSNDEGVIFTDDSSNPRCIRSIDSYKLGKSKIVVYGSFLQCRVRPGVEQRGKCEKFTIWRIYENDRSLIELLEKLERAGSSA